jgi:hypothetical protein
MHTKDVFRQCVGRIFRVRGIGTNNAGQDTNHVELWVRKGSDCEHTGRADTIWVEPEFLEIVIDQDAHL